MRKKVKKNSNKRTVSIAITLFLITSFVVIKKKANEIDENKNLKITYEHLKQLEGKDINSIEEDFKKINKTINKKVDIIKDSMSDSDFFKQSVFMGDSITEAIGYYKVIEPSNVVGVKGQNVISAKESVNIVKDKNPNEIFMLYGMNDLEIFNDKKDFISHYKTLIEDIKTKLPDTKIYVESILYTSSKINIQKLSKERIVEFNEALKKMTEELDINYLDITKTIDGKDELYENDGIHPKPSYYKIYMNYIREKIKS